jgi:hypothetical protein
MVPPQYLLSHYIKNLKNTDNVNKYLYQKYNIMTKDFTGMTIYYNKYDSKHKTTLESASRSVIMDDKYNVLCYTCNTPLYNSDSIQYLWRNKDKEKTTYVCYEGSFMSVFSHNNEWYLASRKNILNISNYININININIGEETKPDETGGQFKMFIDVLSQDNKTINEFCSQLNPEYTYHFVLIHHQNKNIVDYETMFGKEYKKLCFIFARKQSTQEEIKPTDVDSSFASESIILPTIINEETAQLFISKLADDNVMQSPDIEGLIIKVNNQVLKLQSSAYQFHKSIGSDKNMFRGFINLYQNNVLKKFFTNENNNNIKTVFKKIVNPMNTTESFDTMGMIDALFKVITSELHKLFYLLWNDNGSHDNKDLYKILPREYKDMMFHLRGVFFANKAKSQDDDNFLKMKDVYNFIKTIDISTFEGFIRCRKLMLNWTRVKKTDDENVVKFVSTLYKCEKVYYKLAAIYTTKLFPEIMPEDMPTFGTAGTVGTAGTA